MAKTLFILLLALVPFCAFAGQEMLVKPGDRMVTFGDSISTGKGYGYLAVELMNKEQPELKLTWAAQGYPGWKSSDAVTVVEKVLAEKPTLVTIMFGTNDLGQKGARAIADFAVNMRKLVEPLQQAGVRVVLLTTPYANPHNMLANEWDRAGLPRMVQRLQALGKELNVPVFDMFTAMKQVDEARVKTDPTFSFFLNDDGVHPGPDGHAIMARMLADYLLGKTPSPKSNFAWKHPAKPVGEAQRYSATWMTKAVPMVIDSKSQTLDPARWKGRDDLSMRAYAAWDPQMLYLKIEVTDDVVLAGEKQPAWGHDGIELFLDVRPRNARDIAFAPGYFQLLVAVPAQDGPAPVTCGAMDTLDAAQIRAAYQRTATGYNFDLTIPWSSLRFSPKAHADLGLDFAINDRDDAKIDRYKILWRGAGDDFTNAGSLGTLVLK